MATLTAIAPEKIEHGFRGRPALTRLYQSSFRSSVVRLEQTLEDDGSTSEIATIADEIIVGLAPEKSPTDLQPILAKLGARIHEIGYAGDWLVVKMASQDTDAYYAAIASLAGQKEIVRFAEPNFFVPNALKYQLLSPPTPANDTSYTDGTQWSLNNPTDVDIDAPEGWTLQTNAANIVVAVVDSGIDLDHPDLDDNLWDNGSGQAGYDFVNGDTDPDDDTNHGTHVAGIIGAEGNNSTGVTGVCWEVQLMAVKSADAGGSLSAQSIADGIDYSRLNGANIINMSFGGLGDIQIVRTAIENAQNAGILLVVAAGNELEDLSSDPNGWPARYASDFDNLVVVGSTNSNDEINAWAYQVPPDPTIYFAGSDYDESLVHLSAPGSGLQFDASDAIFSTIIGGYGRMWGTSQAAPHVTGIAALLLARFGALSPSELRNRLLASVDVIPALNNPTLGLLNATSGRANLHHSLSLFSDLPRDTDGWRTVPTLGGEISDNHAPWYYHQDLEWLYSLDATRDDVWFFSGRIDQWIYTYEAAFPWIYRDGPDAAWCYFYGATPSGTLWFWNSVTEEAEFY